MQTFFKKNIGFVCMLLLAGLLIFSPAAKAFFLTGLMRTGVFNATHQKDPSLVQKQLYPSLSFTDKMGNRLSVRDLKGKVVFINFWATWCPPCIAEMPAINRLYNKLKTDTRYVFIMADADNNLQEAAAFMKKHQYRLPVYQSAGAVAADLFSGTLPTTLIIDSNGNLVQKYEGIANYDTAGMLSFLQGL